MIHEGLTQNMPRTTLVELTNMCMIYDAKGNVLVQDKIGKNIRGLIFPGGHIENRESIVDSVIREVKEETGLTISKLHFCGIKDWVEADSSRYMVFLYKTNVFKGDIKPSSEGNVFWMPIEELRQKDTLWHLNMMLDIFCNKGPSELYYDVISSLPNPLLK